MKNNIFKNSVTCLLGVILLGTLSLGSFAQYCSLDLSPPNDTATVKISAPWWVNWPDLSAAHNPSSLSNQVMVGNAVVPAGPYLAWCIDIATELSPYPTTYGAFLYSSCDPDLNTKLQALDAAYGSINFPPSVYVSPEVWNKINYLLNHRNGAYFYNFQLALWNFIGGPIPPSYYGGTSQGWPPSDVNEVNQLVADANANADNWRPQCGDTIAVIVAVDNWPSPIQLTIIEIPFPCVPCIGVEKLIACLQPLNDCGEFGKFAAGFKGLQDPAFCYQVTVSNCGTILLTNLAVTDTLLGDVTTDFFPDPTATLAPGASVTVSFKVPIGTIGFTTNTAVATGHASLAGTVTNGSEVITNGTEVQGQDEAVAQVENAVITCSLTLDATCDLDGNTNDNHVLLPACSPCSVTFRVRVCNPGAADLTGVTIDSSALKALGCSMPGGFDLLAGNCVDVDLCADNLGCPPRVTDVKVTVVAQVKSDANHCGIYDVSSTNVVSVGSECSGEVECNPGLASVCGLVLDCNSNALTDVTVTLTDSVSNALATANTDTNGGYCFAGLQPGTYIVVVTPPANTVQYLDPDNTNDNQTVVTLAECQQLTGVNFGYTDATPPSITCPLDLILCASDPIPAPDISSVTATDNSGGLVIVTFVGAVTNRVCTTNPTVTREAFDVYQNSPTCTQPISPTCTQPVPNRVCRTVITRIYQATDACQNSATCTQTITIGSAPPCTLSAPCSLPVAETSGNTLSGPVGDYTYSWSITTDAGSGWAITSATNIRTITYTAGMEGTKAKFTLVVTDKATGCSSTCEVCFGTRVCASGCTPGFWGNKNGLSLITSSDFAALNTECLRNGNGSNKDFTGSLNNQKSQFDVWLKNRNAVNMAYQFSAHLAAFTLNVRHKFICGNTMIPVPGCGGSMTANALIAAANNALCSDGYTPTGDANRAYQECLKNALANANQNCTKTVKVCP